MKHIKIYEEYSDDELKDLIGDLKSVGHSRVPLDIDFGPFLGMGGKDKEREMDIVDSWSFPAPEGEIKVKSGSVKFSPQKDLKVVLNMTNGDVIEMEVEHRGGGTSFSVNGDWPTPLQYQEWGNEYPYTLDALVRYDHYLVSKYDYGKKPTFFQKLKKKLGLSESYSDDDIKSLLGDLRSVGHSLTEDEEDMLKFVNQFGGGMSAEDYAETLYDYFNNPEEYGIDKEGDYYDMIWYLYENSVEDHARFILGGSPMRMGTYNRWEDGKIAQEPLYKLYLKMSDYYSQNRK